MFFHTGDEWIVAGAFKIQQKSPLAEAQIQSKSQQN